MDLIREAIRDGNIDRLKMLLQDVNLNDMAYGSQLLINIAKRNNFPQKIPIAEALLEAGANVNVQNDKGSSPLYFSVLKNDIDMVKLLIAYGANLDILTGIRTSPLKLAIINNNIKIAKLLLDSGANPNIKDHLGVSLLHHAVSKRKIDFIELLLEAGADSNIKNENGQTPLNLTNDGDIKDLFESYLYNIKEPDN